MKVLVYTGPTVEQPREEGEECPERSEADEKPADTAEYTSNKNPSVKEQDRKFDTSSTNIPENGESGAKQLLQKCQNQDM